MEIHESSLPPKALSKREAEIIILEEGPGNKARKCWYGPEAIESGRDVFRGAQVYANHPTKSHIVVAKEGDKVKTIRFGEQGAKTAGKPKKGESDKMKKKRKSFKARHKKNIDKGKMSAAYWADKVKW